MDTRGLTLPVLVAGVSALGLWWNFVLARRGKAERRDRVLGAVWAALLVLALARIVALVVAGDPSLTPPAEPPPTPGK